MKHEVHQAKPVCVRNELDPDEGVVPLKERLRLLQLVKIVGLILDVTISRDEKPACARSWVLHDFAGLRLHQANDAINQRTRREVLPCPDFFSAAFFSSKPFVEVPEPFFSGGEPVELVDCVW